MLFPRRDRWDEPEEPECDCDERWERNCRFAEQHADMPLMAWCCPLHGVVFPDEEGRPMPLEWVEALMARTKAQREAERRRRTEQLQRPIERYHARRELVAHG